MRRILLWGAGCKYNEYRDKIHNCKFDGIKIVGIVANGMEGPYVDEYPVIKKTDIHLIPYDYIMIMSNTYYEEIVREALAIGIEKEKILCFDVLDYMLPGFGLRKWLEVREKKFTIISNNCWGGLLYHALHLECLSPFKNLFLMGKDYLKLCNNLKYYLEKDVVFKEYGVIPSGDMHPYPVLSLGDIDIHCNHDTEPEKAIADWKRRCKKINWDNLFVEMYTQSEEAANQFLQLNQLRIKYVLYLLNHPIKT